MLLHSDRAMPVNPGGRQGVSRQQGGAYWPVAAAVLWLVGSGGLHPMWNCESVLMLFVLLLVREPATVVCTVPQQCSVHLFQIPCMHRLCSTAPRWHACAGLCYDIILHLLVKIENMQAAIVRLQEPP